MDYKKWDPLRLSPFSDFFWENPTDVLSICINNNIAATFIPNLDNIILSVDGAATILA